MSWLKVRSNEKHASVVVRRPKARSAELYVEELDNELLIYDQFANRAHCLSSTAAQVWRACDGYTTTEVIANTLDLDAETLERALYELEECALLEEEPSLGHTRRETMIKFGKYGAAASLPFIYSTLGPVAMAAATPTPAQCLFYSAASCDGCTGICGCCCCCQGCGGAAATTSCKICYPTSLCTSTSGPNCGSSGFNCSSGPGNTNCGAGKNCCSTTSKSNCVQPCTVTDCAGHPCGCTVNGQQVGGGTCPT
jgi:hypothetical protein